MGWWQRLPKPWRPPASAAGAVPYWPDDGSWLADAVAVDGFRIDAGYAVSSFVPGWMLADATAKPPPVSLPALPQVLGHVLTADAIGREAELIRHFAALPPLPDTVAWRERVGPSLSLDVNVLLCLADGRVLTAECFGGSWWTAAELLAVLGDPAAPPDTVYDDLDQGWAARIVVAERSVFMLEWDPEPPRRRRDDAVAVRMPREVVWEQARAAEQRLRTLHRQLVDAVGRDLWHSPSRT